MTKEQQLQIVLEVVAKGLKEELDKIGVPDWRDPNFSAIAGINGIKKFVEDKVKEYAE